MAIELDKVNFKNGRENPVLAEHFNNMQDNIQEAITTLESKISSMPIGSGCDYFGTTPPENFMFADGSAISRTTYAALFAVIGTTYGEGDSETTFNLPDKRSRVTVAKDDGTFNELGKTGGEEEHILTINEIPSHNHTTTLKKGAGSAGTTTPGLNANINSSSDQNYTSNNQGGGQAHNNLQPYLVCNYIIKVK